MEAFADYSHAIVSVALMVVFGLVLSPLSAVKKTGAGLAPGCEPDADYGSSVYRWHRTYVNLAETMGFFVGAVGVAILAGANPFWVNLLASLFFVSRLVLAFVHIKGIGKPDMSARSFLYVAGWLACIILCLMAVLAVLG